MEVLRQNRLSSRIRAMGCVLLLALLAVCGWMGASRDSGVQTVSVPVTRNVLEAEEIAQATNEEIKARLETERKQELDMLEGVLTDGRADDATVRSALLQKSEIAARMENEAQTEALLAGMGYGDALCVSGAQMLTLILPEQSLESQEDRVRVIDAVSAQSGVSAENVKIILIKK